MLFVMVSPPVFSLLGRTTHVKHARKKIVTIPEFEMTFFKKTYQVKFVAH